MFPPRMLMEMADYIGSTLDLGNATESELTAMAVQAIAAGYGYEIVTSN